jgi:N-glycosylase/DNA lyase
LAPSDGDVGVDATFNSAMALHKIADLQLRGPGGEPIDLARTLSSHGVAALPPNRIDERAWTFETTLSVGGAYARTVRLEQARRGDASLFAIGRTPSRAVVAVLVATVSHMLRLNEDLSGFYALCAGDPDLDWVRTGAGRMLRAPTVFEDVVKTICTTNTSWSGTERMVGALVEHIGQQAPEGHRAFPSASAMASAGDAFYRDIARAGYRGAYLRSLADNVATGALDLELLADPQLPDTEVADRLLALPGVGPYASAHLMLTSLGRYQRLILDSWTRPTYARLIGREPSDKATERHFRRYGSYAGLAHWLRLTRAWVAD